MNVQRVIFLNRFYWPEEPATAQLLTDLAEGLAAEGFAVSVVTRMPPGSERPEETRNGVQILRVRASALGRRSLLGRTVDFASFLAGARTLVQRKAGAGDAVVCMTDPPLLGAAQAHPVSARGARLVHWVQDIFPEVATAVSGLPLLNLAHSWRDRAWRRASFCVAPGNDMAEFVRSRGPLKGCVHVSSNWAPEGVRPTEGAAWRHEHDLTSSFVVMYSGNLGRVHDFSAVVPLARSLSGSRVQLVFVGGGAQRADLQDAARAAGLGNVRFLPAQPRERLAEVLSAADVHLVTLRTGCECYVFPSKLYGIAAAGKPAVIIAPRHSEPARLVEQQGFGLAFESTQQDELTHHVRRLEQDGAELSRLGANALLFAQAHRGRSRAVREWTGFLRGTNAP